MIRRVLPLGLALALFSCGGGNGTPPGPTATTTTIPANRNPVISSVTATPSFGIMGVSAFNFAALASDPDGDTVTYTWDIAGNARTGPNVGPVTFTSGAGVLNAAVTVTDGRGGSSSGSANFVLGNMTGRWVGTMPGFNLTYNFTQSTTGVLTATFTTTGPGITVNGILDPAAPNTITSGGRVTFRSKITSAGFLDYSIVGDMDNTGARFNGSVSGSGLNGAVVLTKQ